MPVDGSTELEDDADDFDDNSHLGGFSDTEDDEELPPSRKKSSKKSKGKRKDRRHGGF